MAVLYASDGSIVRGVKNLGWLLRNWGSAPVSIIGDSTPYPGPVV